MQHLPYQIRSPQIFDDPLVFLLLMHYKTKWNMNPKADNCTFEMLYKQDETQMSLESMSSKSLNITSTPFHHSFNIHFCNFKMFHKQHKNSNITWINFLKVHLYRSPLYFSFLRNQMHVMKLYFRCVYQILSFKINTDKYSLH